jgi:hypothetical protein
MVSGLRHHLRFTLRRGIHYTPDVSGIACWLPPGANRADHSALDPVGPTLVPVGPDDRPHPARQRHWHAVAKPLLLERADARRLPCYQDTHDQKNVAFYSKRGFELVRSENLPGYDPSFWCMVRQPKTKT